MQGQQVAQGADDVLGGENALLGVDVQAQLLVDLVAAHLGQVVALVVEVEAVDQGAGRVHGGGLAGALAAVDLDEGVLAGEGLVEGVAHDLGVAEEVDNLVVGLGDAQGAQEDHGRLAALAVDGHDQVAVLVDLEL